MAFRADETTRLGYERAETYLVPREADETQRARSREALRGLFTELGPVVDTYPSWHPLVSNSDRHYHDVLSWPCRQTGYSGLDHTICFVHGFITCPYTDSGQAEDVIKSVEALPRHPGGIITAEVLDVQLYNPAATPVLVRCEWDKPIDPDGTIPLRVLLPLLLEREVPCWQWSEVAETWETMRPDLIGTPHGSLSSLFVSQATGQAIKNVWNTLIASGMFGPVRRAERPCLLPPQRETQ